MGGTAGDHARTESSSYHKSRSVPSRPGRRRPTNLGIPLACVWENDGQTAAGPGSLGPSDLRIFGSSPASGRQHGVSRPVRRGWRRGTKAGRGSMVGGSHRRRAESRRGPGIGGDPPAAGASPAACGGRTCHEGPTYDRVEPVRDVRRPPAQRHLLPDVRPLLLLVGVPHAAPRAALGPARADRLLPGRVPARRAAGPDGRTGVRPVNKGGMAEGGYPTNPSSASRDLAGNGSGRRPRDRERQSVIFI